ncbi:exopolysaccharide biosynthesis polyprenyl glycosylphosphotransferase [Streptomyces sp. XD-27]|uniref:exopolysaccharide biosynthesis polyprenyl glycosylphosphotransferase n=1 Tax=Streptomyces sp. XD-27 TaxID=3062779 RepID=UPI0026F41CA0|nr:exopolysaccharide biosynthesis polyprenyl glycosylphosphotransferase [Streptomyces sp. XD-27]WKX69526.1 exopolysaccharide biosynthesis polyprenyl glycosylphosphotransferase [Streptomyces sp. XD-27]
MTTDNAGAPPPGQLRSPQATAPRQAAAVHAPRRPDSEPGPAPARRTAPTRVVRATARLVTVDCAAAVAAAAPLLGDPRRAAVALGPALAAAVCLAARGGLHRPGRQLSALDEAPRLLRHCALAWLLAGAAVATIDPARTLRWPLLAILVTSHWLLVCVGRGVVYRALRRDRRRHPRPTLIVGSGPAAWRLAEALHGLPEYGMRPVALIATGPAGPGGAAGPGGQVGPAAGPESAPYPLPVLDSAEDIARTVTRNAVRHAVFTRGPESAPSRAALVRLLTGQGCTVWLPGGGSDHIWGYTYRRLDPPRPRRLAVLGKRALDIAIALPLLPIALPLMLLCAVAVRFSVGRGVVFRQERVGRHGRTFTMLKFRTLPAGTDADTDAEASATVWNAAADQRVGAVGRLLRRTWLDDLPQLWNVLRGDMSLVGPRPERPHFVRQFSQAHPGYAFRHRMPVGITGLAQLHGLRGDTSIEDRARFDNHYIDTWTLWGDVRILLRTARFVLRRGRS